MRTALLVSMFLACSALLAGGCGGGGGGSTATPPVPTLTAVTPAQGPLAGGTAITLTGSGFSSGGVSVQVGGVFATGVGVVNDTTITCATPAHTTHGPHDIIVTTIGGVVTLPAAYTCLDPFVGPYNYAGFTGDSSIPSGVAEWGLVTTDGLGTVTGVGVDWNDTEVTGSSPITPFPYRIDAPRRLTFVQGAVDTDQGGVSASGDLAITASIENPSDPAIALLSRRTGSFSNASLNDNYIVCMMFFDSPDESSAWGTAVFNGTGGVTVTLTRNINGSVSAPLPVFNDTYSVAANGAFEWNLSIIPTNTQRGGVLLGGDLVICGGGSANGMLPIFAVFIRESAAAGLGSLNGPYHLVGIQGRTGAPNGWQSYTGMGSSNGAGLLTLGALEQNVDGAVATLPAGLTLNYAVAGNGEIQVNGVLSRGWGAVGPGGRFACWAGSTTNTEDPQLFFLLR